MYPVSDAFINAVESNARQYYWTGTITTKNKKVYEFTNEDIVQGSGYITRQCCGSSEIELGTVYSSELGISLFSSIDRYTLEDATIEITYHLVLDDGTVESVPMGIFEVSEANRSTKTLELKAYDYMLRFEKALKLNASSGSAYHFLHTACTECKVEMAQTKAEIDAFPNAKEVLGVYADNDMETYRDLIYFVAQVLGCICQINREGKLELKAYSDAPVATIQQKHRFDSTYSDFVTRYTAVSSTNMNTQSSEYYALDVDDGLTLNLGVNPLLQFGLKSTRARIIGNILTAISKVAYVPFDANTIGNPALEPMDALKFSGGHADESKISCITSITYNINGRHALKCVGKNPRLASAKSKNEKNISGLLSQVEAEKIVVYNFMNTTPFMIGSSTTEVVAITFTAKEETTATFYAQVLLGVTTTATMKTLHGSLDGSEVDFTYTDSGSSELTVTYKMNNSTIATFIPKETYESGNHILSLFMPLSQVVENSENTFSVTLSMTGGTASIAELGIRAVISGQGLVAGAGDWNGRINLTEDIDRVSIDESALEVDTLVDTLATRLHDPLRRVPEDFIERISIYDSALVVDALQARVVVSEIVKTFTVDEVYPPSYDITKVDVGESGFSLITDYTYVSQSEEINFGKLQHLTIDTTEFSRVMSIEVSDVSL